MIRNVILVLFVFQVFALFGQKDTLVSKHLKPFTVLAEKLTIYSPGTRLDQADSILKVTLISNTLASLLDASTGLVIRSYGPGILASSSLRGGNAQQTSLAWNGISINNPCLGITDLNLIPAFLFDGIIVQPGLSGSLQGSGAIGGGINLSNSAPKNKGFSFQFLNSFGSFGSLSQGIKLSYFHPKWSNETKWFYTKSNTNYPYINTAEFGNPTQRLTNAKTENISAMNETTFKSIKAGTFKLSWWGTFAQRSIPPTMLMANSEALQHDKGNKTMLQWDKNFQFIQVKFKSLWQKDYLLYEDPTLQISSLSNSEILTNDAEFRLKPGKNSSFSLGVIQSNTKALASQYNTTAYRSQTAFWGSFYYRLAASKTRLSMSLRQEIVDKKQLPLIPTLGFRTNLSKYLDIYGQFSRVYRIPTLNDMYWVPGGNTALKPESGWAGELSSEYYLEKKQLEFRSSITGFTRLISNWIQWQPLDAIIWTPINIGKVRSRGIEWRNTLKVMLSKTVSIHGSVSMDYTESTIYDKSNLNYQNQLIYIPYLKGAGYAAIMFKKTTFLVNSVMVGKRYTTSDNSYELPSYALLNLSINQQFGVRKILGDLFFKINNVTNTSYQAIAWRPMPGIHFETGITIKFN